MAVDTLASAQDVADLLGRDLSAEESRRLDPILAKASELFRRRSGQQFTPGTSTVRLKVNGGRVHLTQYPVTAVNTVTDDAGDDVEYAWRGQWLDVALTSADFVTVDYDHGGDVPDLVRIAVADIGKKVLQIPADAAMGMTQFAKTRGPFSESGSYAAWAIGGQTILGPADDALALSFRVPTPTVWVSR